MDLQLVIGRPADVDTRLEKERRCYDLLDSLGVTYARIDHDAADTMHACAAVDKELGTTICKNLFLTTRKKTAYYLLMMPAEKPFRTAELSKQIGSSRLSFGEPEPMEQYLDVTPGSVSILGLMNDHDNAVKLLVDEDLLKAEYVGCHPCINTTSLRIKSADLYGTVLPSMHHEMTVVTLGKE